MCFGLEISCPKPLVILIYLLASPGLLHRTPAKLHMLCFTVPGVKTPFLHEPAVPRTIPCAGHGGRRHYDLFRNGLLGALK